VLVSANVGVLHYVFRLGIVVQDGARDAVEALVVPAHDDLVERSLSPTNAARNLLVGKAFRCCPIWNYGRFHRAFIP
jgi:hypothetical protein